MQWTQNSPRHHIDRNSQEQDIIGMGTTSSYRDDATHLTYTPLERETPCYLDLIVKRL